MVFAAGKLKHSASIAKRRIVERKLSRISKVNPPAVPTERYVQRITEVMPSERSVTHDKKMIKRPILQFFPAHELANVQYGKTRGEEFMTFSCSVFGRMERVIHVVDIPKMGRTSVYLFTRVSLAGNADSFASDGVVNSTPHHARVTHANTFSRVA